MEIRQLRSFIALADDLHFGRAAARVGVSQPSLSLQIRNLERDLGVVLVERTSRRVELTPAGEVLLDGARAISAELERTRDAVRDVVAGRSGRLVVGSVAAGFNGVLVPVLRRLRLEAPLLDVTLRELPSGPKLVQQLRDGVLDVALLRGSPIIPAMRVEPLLEESFVAVLPGDHRLAGGDAPLSLAELADEPFVLWPRELGPSFHDEVIAGCLRHGFNPAVAAQADSLEAQLALVAAGVGVSVQAASNAGLSRAGVVMRPLVPEDVVCTLTVAYPRGRRAPGVDRFLQIAADAVRDGEFAVLGVVRRPQAKKLQ